MVTRHSGRNKLHFLNPVPIRLIHDRWIDKYTEPWAAATQRAQAQTGDHRWRRIYEIYIRTTPERLWEAITDPEIEEQVHLRRPGRLRLEGRVSPLEMGAPESEWSPRRG